MVSFSFILSYGFRDLWRQKVRTIFGVLGIALSIFLLSTVSFAMDSLSASFVDYLTLEAGNQDITIEVNHYYGEPDNRTDYFTYAPIAQQLLDNVSEIEHIIPRLYMVVRSNGNPLNRTNETIGYYMGGLNISYEEQIQYGRWYNLTENLSIKNGLPVNSCMVSPEVMQDFHLKEGDLIEIYIPTLKAYVNLTVISIFEQNMKFQGTTFSSARIPSIIVDLNWWGQLADSINKNSVFENFSWVGAASRLIILLKNPQQYYDVKDIQGSETKIQAIGTKIAYTIGIKEWSLDYPKLNLLQYSEYFTLVLNMLFMVITFVAMLISGILIHGILTTSIEERIREYGINRVLGAHSSYNVKLILLQASLLAFIGTTTGVILAIFLVRDLVIPFIQSLLEGNDVFVEIVFILRPQTVIISYLIGIGVSMAVSLAPALKVKRMSIVASINPYRHTEDLFSIKKKASTNTKLILLGAILSFNGLFIYFILPQAFLSLDIGIIAGVLISTLLLFLVGISLLAIGLIPVFIRILLKFFTPIARKYIDIIRINVYRHERRNLSTIIILILSFSFIMFTTSSVEIQLNQVSEMIRFNYGSDLQIVPLQYDLSSLTAGFEHEVMQLDGVERTSSVLVSTYDLTQIYINEGKEFGAQLGDYINYRSYRIRLYGIDENYKDIVYDPSKIVFKEGNKDEAFKKVFAENESNVIISTALSITLNLHVGDRARLTIQRGDEQEPIIVTIVGVASSIPGLRRFKQSASEASNGGVICSEQNYVKFLNIAGGDNAFVDRIYVKVKDGYSTDYVEQEIIDLLGEERAKTTNVRNVERSISNNVSQYKVIEYLFLVILGGTAVIGLFGLISSAYSSIIERKREIGIIRTLGLHGNEVRKLFTDENLILLLASSTSGGSIGYLISFMMTRNMILFTETPSKVAVPWDIVAIIYLFAIFFLIIGMRFLMRKVQKQNLIQIFRETQ